MHEIMCVTYNIDMLFTNDVWDVKVLSSKYIY